MLDGTWFRWLSARAMKDHKQQNYLSKETHIRHGIDFLSTSLHMKYSLYKRNQKRKAVDRTGMINTFEGSNTVAFIERS